MSPKCRTTRTCTKRACEQNNSYFYDICKIFPFTFGNSNLCSGNKNQIFYVCGMPNVTTRPILNGTVPFFVVPVSPKTAEVPCFFEIARKFGRMNYVSPPQLTWYSHVCCQKKLNEIIYKKKTVPIHLCR